MSIEAKDVAIGVLDGRESVEQAAQRLGVSVDEVTRWCELARLGVSLGQARRGARPWAVGLGGLVALGLVSLWARSAISAGCADPTHGPLPASMIKLCPESAALAGPVNTNFAQLSKAISTKFQSPKLGDPPGKWVSSATIAPGAIDSSRLADNSITSAFVADGIVPGSKFLSITKQKISRQTLYKMDPACYLTQTPKSPLDSPSNASPLTPTATCPPLKSSNSIPPCPNGQSRYLACGSTNVSPTCTAAPTPCNNVSLGVFVAP